MEQVYVDALVSGRRSERVRFLIDTGATYAVVPPSLARRLGAPASSQTFDVSPTDGRFSHRGPARRSKLKAHACTLGVKIGKREAPVTTLLIPGAEPLLGVETLEALGLRVDPKAGTLEPSRGRVVMLVGARNR